MESDADLVAATAAAGGTIFLCGNEKLESDADLVAATITVGGLFFFATTKIRIGHGPHCRPLIRISAALH